MSDSPPAEEQAAVEAEAAAVPPAVPPAAVPPGDLPSQVQAVAPHVDAAFIAKYQLDDAYLQQIVNREVPAPPDNGPDTSATELYKTDGGWQLTAAGMAPGDAEKAQVGRS
jgi:hypothetical protein